MNNKKFKKQTFPSLIYGGNSRENTDLESLFFNFPLEEILTKPQEFYESVSSIYEEEKRLNPIGGENTRFINLVNLEDLAFADFHLKVHAITGLPELGTSNTKNIPYWDRQSVEFGFRHHFESEGQYYMEESDIEVVNILRVFIRILEEKLLYASLAKRNIENLMARAASFTRKNIDSVLEEQFQTWKQVANTYETVLIAKIKHLVFCADRISSQSIRKQVLKEVEEILKKLDIPTDVLTINLGVDGGVTEDTDRPAYQIEMLAQLQHLGADTVSLPKECVVLWPFEIQRESLLRGSQEPSSLEEPKEYILHWDFYGPSKK